MVQYFETLDPGVYVEANWQKPSAQTLLQIKRSPVKAHCRSVALFAQQHCVCCHGEKLNAQEQPEEQDKELNIYGISPQKV